jgi:hypothetical protein
MPQPPNPIMEHNPQSNVYQPVPQQQQQQLPSNHQNNIALQQNRNSINPNAPSLSNMQSQQMASPQLVQEASAPNMFKMQKGRSE